MEGVSGGQFEKQHQSQFRRELNASIVIRFLEFKFFVLLTFVVQIKKGD